MMQINKKKLIQNIPIIFFFGYLTVTVILFAFGPWQWPINSPLKLYGFLAIAHLSLVLGYISLKGNSVPTYPKRRKPKWGPENIVAVSSLLNIVFFVLLFFSNVEERIAITEAALDPARAYAQLAVSELERTGTTMLTYIRFIFAPVLLLSIPLGIMFWEKLGKKTRVAVLLTITTNLLLWTTTGKNKGFADFILIIPWFLFARVVAGKWKPKRTLAILTCALFIGFSILFLFYFSINYEGRMGTYGGSSSSLGIHADYDNIFVRHFPDRLQYGMAGLAGYITNGYFGLSLSLDRPFFFSYGIGHSIFLHNIVFPRLFNITAPMERSYPYQVEESTGWLRLGHWHSIYPWLASDVTFYGTFIVIFLIGRLLAMSWSDTISGSSLLAPVVLYQLLMMLYYFPANNQALAFGDGVMSFWTLIPLWIWRRKRIMRKKVNTEISLAE